MEDQIELMVTYLVHLQFYSEDTGELFSRDKQSKLFIHGIAPIVDAFRCELLGPIDLIKTGNYRQYLDEIAKVLPIDIDIVEDDFNRNVSQLTTQELGPELIVNFLVGPIRSNLQNTEFEKAIEDILFLAFMRYKTLRPREELQTKLKDMYSQNDSCVAMLYNLVLLRLLVSKYGGDELQYRVNGWVTKYSNDLVSRIVS
ncbi:MAG: hypothetical protein P1Q69_06100 [Candidatus Thorarchaeota archaeon]|nr:hypothetical protein [Candidatus Thorarchaeota archaeon]